MACQHNANPMVEYRIRFNPSTRNTRIPKILAETFGSRWKLIPDTKAAVIFSEETDPESVLKSLSIIQQDLQLRIEEKRPKQKAD